jgi:hypothetical protein
MADMVDLDTTLVVAENISKEKALDPSLVELLESM